MRPLSASAASALLAALALAGCTGGAETPDDLLPGVRTETAIDDSFHCGALLFAAGCTLVRVEHVESGCAPEVGGYVVCNATVRWSATSGAAEPGSTLGTWVNGTAGAGCAPMLPGACRVEGEERFEHHFSGPGQQTTWNLTFFAQLQPPSGSPATTGTFRLDLRMETRTEGAQALAT